jgi:hypothetical protein
MKPEEDGYNESVLQLMGRAFGGVPRFVGKGGIFQRISIASGFGWLTALSLRACHGCLVPETP